jgi:hypothetical protein
VTFRNTTDRRRDLIGRSGRRIYFLAAISILALLLAAGFGWHSEFEPSAAEVSPRALVLAPVPAATPGNWPAGLTVAGAWQLTSGNPLFGGYSALVASGPDRLTAYSDDSAYIDFAAPGSRTREAPHIGRLPVGGQWKGDRDLEAATSDAASGQRWFAFEADDRIERFGPGVHPQRRVFPPEMAGWPDNGGPEAMTRLADGRFIVLREDADWLSTGKRPGLLFPSDPTEGARALQFNFRPPIGYAPSDMAALPDGRVLILARAIDPPFPPLFKNKLLIADPQAIEPGRTWPWRELATFHGPVPRDNYEGLAVVPGPPGVILWLISDDNKESYQRTLLLELRWRRPPATAAE